MKRRPHDIVEVAWIDSNSMGAEVWNDAGDFHGQKHKTLECRSAGYLLFETKDRIGVVASLALHDGESHDGIAQVSGTITIPKVAITERRVLSKGKS